MASIDDLPNKSISQMTDQEILSRIVELRKSRRQGLETKKAEKVAKVKKEREAPKTEMSMDQVATLILLMEQSLKNGEPNANG